MNRVNLGRQAASLAMSLGACLLLAPGASGQITFSDQTDAAGLTFSYSPVPAYPGPWLHLTSGGGTVGDFNNDGWQDLFVLAGGNGPDKLFINNGDGTFTDRALEWGLTKVHMGAGVAVGDYNNDGFVDMYITSYGQAEGPAVADRHILYRNNGGASFTDVATQSGVNQITPEPDGTSACFGDYDLDGDLDLYVCSWTIDSQGNRLFRNNGDGTFSDVTFLAGLIGSINIRGFSPGFIDMDGDRYPELVVAADGGTSRYFINNTNGTFTESTQQSGVGADQFGMGQTLGDFNNDGLAEWYISSIFLDAAGGEGNKLFINQGGHQFTEIAQAAGVDDGGWGWGCDSVDIDHDGWVDIVEVNGLTTQQFVNFPARVYRNNGDLTFTDVAAASGFDQTGQGRGMVNFDYDNDGDQDFVVFVWEGNLRLFRNDTPNAGAWLRVFLDTSGDPALAPNGFGARVVATVGAQHYTRWISGHSNYLSVSELSAHFGLGSASVVDELRVEWSNGADTVLTNVPVDQTLTIQAPAQAGPADLNGDGVVNGVDLATLLTQWGGPGPADLNGDGVVDGADLASLLASWTL